jgi:hypothetical protein
VDPNERTEHDIIEEAVDHIVYDDRGRDELLEILETYHTPNIAILLNEAIHKWDGYWSNTPEAAEWRKEVEELVRDHITEARRKVFKGDV